MLENGFENGVVDREQRFVSQSKYFINRGLELFGVSNLDELPEYLKKEANPLLPVFIKNYLKVTNEEKTKLAKNYLANDGVVYFFIENHNVKNSLRQHPLIVVSNQLKNQFQFNYPIDYPYDYDSDTKQLFGEPDGTTKVYESNTRKDTVALSNEAMLPHQDGMGLGGTIGIVGLYCESQPLVGGITYFQNLIKVGLQLLKTDEEAFLSLFYPDAITYIRKNERKGIKITSPIFYLNNFGEPTFNLKFADSLHDVNFRNDEALKRAVAFLEKYSRPLSYGSNFIQFTHSGLGCFVNNLQNIHGRTSFLNGSINNQKRILSRKWFSTCEEYSKYQFFPGILIQKKYADLYPEFFAEKFLKGFWSYNVATSKNQMNKL